MKCDKIAGVRDFYPIDMQIRNWLFNKWREISKLYNYVEYDSPIVEYSELYTRKSNDDIINEMYTFNIGKDNKINLCLRPEMTPSIARMIMNVYPKSSKPIKWFSISQCWRYETTSPGRKREHYQWNVDSFGGVNIKTDVELLAMIVRFLKSIGLDSKDCVIKISNRMILQQVLENNNISEKIILKVFNIIDKLNKIDKIIVKELLLNEIDETLVDLIFNIIYIKKIEDLYTFFQERYDFIDELKELFKLFKIYSINEWIELDLTIVRGLSYYTGIVFEGFFRNTTCQRSVFGGGRYDNLLITYNYPTKVPAIRFGFGDIVIIECLKELNKLKISEFNNTIDYCIIPFKNLYNEAIVIAEKIRSKNKIVEIYNENTKKMKRAFSYADRIGANIVLFIAPEEYKNDNIVIKQLRENKQYSMNIDKFIDELI